MPHTWREGEFVRDRVPRFPIARFDCAVAMVAVHVVIHNPFAMDLDDGRALDPIHREFVGGFTVRPDSLVAGRNAQMFFRRRQFGFVFDDHHKLFAVLHNRRINHIETAVIKQLCFTVADKILCRDKVDAVVAAFASGACGFREFAGNRG